MTRILVFSLLMLAAALLGACGVDGEPERPERPEPGITVSGRVVVGVVRIQ